MSDTIPPLAEFAASSGQRRGYCWLCDDHPELREQTDQSRDNPNVVWRWIAKYFKDYPYKTGAHIRRHMDQHVKD